VYDALIAAARARGVKIAGHVSGYVSVEHAMVSQDSIEHLLGYERALAPGHYGLDAWLYADRDRMPRYARLAQESGVWNCPTLAVYANYVTVGMLPADRARVLENRRLFVAALHDAGARILAGTDAGYLVPAGTALLDELDLLREAGLTPYEVLVAATRSPAEYLDLTEEIGTIAVGRRADLVLYRENPLENLSTVRAPVGVMLSGRWISLERPRRRAVRRPVSQQGLSFALRVAADERQ